MLERLGAGGDNGVDMEIGLLLLSTGDGSLLEEKDKGKALSTCDPLILGPGGEMGVFEFEGRVGLNGEVTIDFGLMSPLEDCGKTDGRLPPNDLLRW